MLVAKVTLESHKERKEIKWEETEEPAVPEEILSPRRTRNRGNRIENMKSMRCGRFAPFRAINSKNQ